MTSLVILLSSAEQWDIVSVKVSYVHLPFRLIFATKIQVLLTTHIGIISFISSNCVLSVPLVQMNIESDDELTQSSHVYYVISQILM